MEKIPKHVVKVMEEKFEKLDRGGKIAEAPMISLPTLIG